MFYGWINVIVLFLCYGLFVAPINYGFGSLVPSITTGMGLTLSQAMLGFTLFILAMGLCNPITSASLNRFGAKRTFMLGAALMFVAALLMGYVVKGAVPYYAVFLLYGVAGSLCGPLPLTVVIASWFNKFRGTAMGIALTGGGFAAMLFAPLMAKLAGSGNYSYPFTVLACIIALQCLVVAVFLKNKPSEMGLLPDGAKAGEEVQAGKAAAKKSRVYKNPFAWEASSVFRSPIFYIIVFSLFVTFYSMSSITATAVVYAMGKLHVTKVVAAGAVGMFGLFSIGSRFLGGFLCDLMEPRYVSSIGFVCLSLSMVALLSATSIATVYAAIGLFGLAYGLCYLSAPNMVANYYGLKSFATTNGIVMTVGMGFGSFGPYLTGLIGEKTGSFANAWYIILAMSIIALIGLLFFATPPKNPETATEA